MRRWWTSAAGSCKRKKGEVRMGEEKLSLLVFGAHPDDCENDAGGLALKYRALGHDVFEG